MSRSKIVRKTRKIEIDSVYGSKLISKIINCLMYDGKKDVAINIMHESLEKIKAFARDEYSKMHKKEDDIPASSLSDEPIIAWFVEEAINKISPSVEIRSRRIGGANYQIPVALSPKRRLSLAIRWLISGARIRKERGMVDKLFAEFRDIFADRGEAVKKRDTMHKTAEANKAFAHYGVNG